MVHGQEDERSGGITRRQEVGVHFLSKCQEMNSSVESNPGHISGGNSLGMIVYDYFLCSLNPHPPPGAIPGETESPKTHGLHWAAKGDSATECDFGLIQKWILNNRSFHQALITWASGDGGK